MNASVMITCAGSGIGQSAIDALILEGGYRVLGCDVNGNVYARHFCHEFFVVPEIDSADYLWRIRDLCIREGVDIVIPGHDLELRLFSENIALFREAGIAVVVAPSDLVRISRDKHEWYEFYVKYGCPVVPTYRLSAFIEKPDVSMFPAIIKPRGGSASEGLRIVSEMHEVSPVSDSCVIQPYLFPRRCDPNFERIRKMVACGKVIQMSEISIQMVFSKLSELAGMFVSRNVLRRGIPVLVEPIPAEKCEFLDEVMTFVPVLIRSGVRGPVNIQGRITEKGLVCFEMNMRFTGITGNRAQLGFNEVSFLVNDFLGLGARLGGYTHNKIGVRQVASATIRKTEGTDGGKKTYMLLGAGGYIGSHFLDLLKRKRDSRRIYLLCRDEAISRYEELMSDCDVVVLRDSDPSVVAAFCESDVLVNFVGARENMPDVEMYKAIRFQQCQVVRIMKAGIPIVINISSQSVYDQAIDIPKDERMKPVIEGVYGFQKLLGEELFSSIEVIAPTTRVVSVRLSRVIGLDVGRSELKGFFERVIEQVYRGQSIVVPHPENKISLIDARDAAAAILSVVGYANVRGVPGIVNAGGTNISIRGYCEAVARCVGVFSTCDLIRYGDSADVVRSSMVDSSVLEGLGWRRLYTIEDTIRDVLGWVRERDMECNGGVRCTGECLPQRTG